MVKDCPECGEHTFATRYKDSYLSFCRTCGYWNEVGETGFYDDEKLAEMCERWPIHT